jgi:hypothetical protein
MMEALSNKDYMPAEYKNMKPVEDTKAARLAEVKEAAKTDSNGSSKEQTDGRQ